MNTPDTQLIPASNFEVRKIGGDRLYINGQQTKYILLEGFGIWDKTAGSWVSLGKRSYHPMMKEQQVPIQYKRKKTAIEACSQGLYSGYALVRSVRVMSLVKK